MSVRRPKLLPLLSMGTRPSRPLPVTPVKLFLSPETRVRTSLQMTPVKPKLLPLLRPGTRSGRPLPLTPVKPSHLVSLPTPLIYEILSGLSPRNLANVCKANKLLSGICSDKQFWKFKNTKYGGKQPFKPDRRIYIFEQRMSSLQKQINEQRANRNTQISNLIWSVLPVSDDQNVSEHISETVSIIEVYIEKQNTLKYEDFSQNVLSFIRNYHETFEQWIDSNRDVFKEYSLSEFSDNPLLALIKAIYDVKSSYRHTIYMLRDEKDEIKDVLHELIVRDDMKKQLHEKDDTKIFVS